MAALDWIPPLPPGVEARWDNKQKAYFYINHTTKQTSWHDPRPDYYASQPKDHPPPNPKHKSDGDPVFGFRGSVKKQDGFSSDSVKFLMLKENFPDVPDETIRVVLKIKNNNVAEARNHLIKSGYKCKTEVDHSSAGQLQIDIIVKKLQKVYLLARYDIIRDIVAGCNNNEASARSQLESMGYKAVGTGTTGNAGLTSRAKSRSRSPSPSPTPHKVPEAEKKKMTLRMMAEYHDLGESFIKMALETVHYDEADFKRLVDHYKKTNNSHGKKTGSATGHRKKDDDISFTPTGSLVPVTFSGGMEPVVFGHDDRASPSRTIPFTTSHTSPEKTKAKQKTTTTDQVKKTSHHSRQGPSHHGRQGPSHETIDQRAARLRLQTNQQRAKQVTHTGSTHVVQNQPSSHLAIGPDPTMRKGPDRQLLLTDYASAYGPNPDNYQGPDKDRVHGSQGAYGPDPSLVCGPQAPHANSSNNLLVSAF